jgi:ABC-type antimicrobial peptide transport system permease subunit
MPGRFHIRSFTRGDLKTAVVTLRQNRGRSLMTMFGIIVAVAAVIVVVGGGRGVHAQVQGQAERLGKDLVIVRPQNPQSSLFGSFGSLGPVGGANMLSKRDLSAVLTAHGVQTAVPLGIVDGKIVTDNDNQSFTGSVLATDAGFTSVLHHGVDYGSFLGADSDSDGRAVIGSAVANQLFGETVPLGRSFTFRGREFIVSGILHPFDSNPLLGDADFNDAIFIKYSVAQQLTADTTGLYEILARADGHDPVTETVRSITVKLAAVHGGSHDFSVLKQNQSLAATNSILTQLTGFSIGVAVIVLAIGGIGVMNMMFVSVSERMHEIGIRKAVGATNRQVLSQFMLEAFVLSLAGALLGGLVAYGAIWLLRLFTSFQPLMPWLTAAMAVLAAVIVGTLFGTFPAFKAARKDPIDALRNN